MGAVDILVVVVILLAFGLLILSRMKEKNPKRHAALMNLIKPKGELKDKLRNKFKHKESAQSAQVVLPDSARIM